MILQNIPCRGFCHGLVSAVRGRGPVHAVRGLVRVALACRPVRSGRLSQKSSSVPIVARRRGALGLQTFSSESAQTLAPGR